MKEIVRDLNESRTGKRAAHGRDGLVDSIGDRLGRSSAAGKARQRSDNVELSRRLMQSAAGPRKKARSDVGADDQQRSVGLQAFKQRNQGEEISRACRGKDHGDLSAAAIEAVRGKTCRLFMTDD